MTRDRERTGAWVGDDYAEQSRHHRAFDDWFLQRCPPDSDDVVIDLGCGSGEFSARLASLVPDGRVVGIDGDPSMIEQAGRHAGPNLRFVEAPAERVDTVVEHESADLVVSRAMLHWLPRSQYRRCFEGVLRILRPGGWFHSESAGSGNVAGVLELLQAVAEEFRLEAPPPFPDAGQVFDLIEAAGFETPDEAVRTVAQRRPFDRDGLIGMLRSQAAVALTRQVPSETRDAITQAVVSDVDRLRRRDGTFDQTFVRLEILVPRPTT